MIIISRPPPLSCKSCESARSIPERLHHHLRAGITVLACTMALHGTAAAQADPLFLASASANGINQSREGALPVTAVAKASTIPIPRVSLNTEAFATAQRGAVGVSSISTLMAHDVGCQESFCSTSGGAGASIAFSDLRFEGPADEVEVRLNISIGGSLQTNGGLSLVDSAGISSAIRRYHAQANITVGAGVADRNESLGFVRGEAILVSFKDARPPTTCYTPREAFGNGQQTCEVRPGALVPFVTIGWVSERFVVPTGKNLSLGLTISTGTRASMVSNSQDFPSIGLQGISGFAHTASFPRSGPVFDLPDGFSVSSSQANIAGNQWLGTELATDTEAPTLAIAISSAPNASGWHNAEVTLSVSAEDNAGGSGVRSISCNAAGAQALDDSTLEGAFRSLAITTEGATTVTCTAQDILGNVSGPASVEVRFDRTPPTVRFDAPSPPANQAGWNNTAVSVPFFAADWGSGISSTNPSGAMLALVTEGGSVTGSVVVTDLAGNTATFVSPAVRIDTTPPTLTGLPTSCNLWPPNHQLVNVATVVPGDALSGIAPGSFRIDGNSTEPEDAKGSGNTAPDIVITGGDVQLRAERSGGGTGRLYTIAATVLDLAGNVRTGSGTCLVPHDQGKNEKEKNK